MAKILLVEDDKSLREIYGVRLSAEGYEIVSAGDGEEALAMAIKERPDLIVSDVMMPKISGFDMLDILRSTSETKDVKVIMMTALSSDDQRARGEALGADRYLVKSQVGIEDVVRTVHDVLQDGIGASAAAPAPVPAAPAPTEPVAAPVTPDPAQVAPDPVSPQVAQTIPVNPIPQAAPVTTPAPTPAPAPTVPVTPSPMTTPITAPVAAPVMPAPADPVTPAPQPFQAPPVMTPQPAPVAMPAPQPAQQAPAFASASPVQDASPQPMTPPQPVVLSELPVSPAPVASSTPLPQPTAPFSSPAPASLGERVIQPLTMPTNNQADIAQQIEQALSGTPVPPAPSGQPPVPPAA